jgi:hypothetical protein
MNKINNSSVEMRVCGRGLCLIVELLCVFLALTEIAIGAKIVAWGRNNYGLVTPPTGNDFIAIDACNEHCLALRSDGSIVGWGKNDYGQATPPSGNDFIAIATGYNHSLALRTDGSLVAWGFTNGGLLTPPQGNDCGVG